MFLFTSTLAPGRFGKFDPVAGACYTGFLRGSSDAGNIEGLHGIRRRWYGIITIPRFTLVRSGGKNATMLKLYRRFSGSAQGEAPLDILLPAGR